LVEVLDVERHLVRLATLLTDGKPIDQQSWRGT